MTASEATAAPIRSVLHVSDFGDDSEAAFAHALAIALLRQADLTILHAGRQHLDPDEWRRFPAVRSTLERWGLLEPGSDRSAVFEELAVRVKKVAVSGSRPLAAIEDYLADHAPDLLVLGTEARQGLPRWLHPSAGERIARATGAACLFVPSGARGFVDPASGRLTLRRILVPIDHRPRPDAAIAYAARAATVLGDGAVEMLLLHVGDDAGPAVPLPEAEACAWTPLTCSGDAVEEISRTAEARDVDLVAMATAGRDGILDALRGSVTEQVLRHSRRVLLAVPSS